jgi:uncharacterized membrane protein
VSYHPGWHAAAPIYRDARGMMWLRPISPGETAIDLSYDGGWELRLCGWLSLSAAIVAALYAVRGVVR